MIIVIVDRCVFFGFLIVFLDYADCNLRYTELTLFHNCVRLIQWYVFRCRFVAKFVFFLLALFFCCVVEKGWLVFIRSVFLLSWHMLFSLRISFCFRFLNQKVLISIVIMFTYATQISEKILGQWDIMLVLFLRTWMFP